jgi:hypothetical protein
LFAAETEFARLLGAASDDERVVGLVLGGSRGKDSEYVTPHSDFDAYVIVANEPARDKFVDLFPTRHGDPIEVIVATLDLFRSYALPGSASERNAYTFAHVTPVIDRLDGEIARLTLLKGQRDPDSSAPEFLDGYINLYYRARKSYRDGLLAEARLDAAESVPLFLDFLFAAFGRVRPYNKWLPWELRKHPLSEPWSEDRVLRAAEEILSSADVATQRRLFVDTERLARSRGWGGVIDGWEPDVQWLRGEAG